MERQKNTQLFVIGILAVAVLTMSIGFAAFTEKLNIEGTANVSVSSWKVAFNAGTYKESEGSVASTTPQINETSLTYDVTLEKPGDFYEFTIDIENTGTFDANLTGITLAGVSKEQDNYIDYTVKYGQTPYTASASSLSVPLAKQSGKETVTVRVEYVAPSDSTLLPSSVQKMTLTAAFDYTQK